MCSHERVIVQLSCDLGESRNADERRVEAELWALVDAANVACGGHVGDASSMREAVLRARDGGVILGAHPSYPDREGFGRRSIDIPFPQLRASLRSQIDGLRTIAEREGVPLARVKPHGALYNDAHHDDELARCIVDAVRDVSAAIAVVAAPGSRLLACAEREGLQTVREAFADRRYRCDGSLVPRSEPGSLLLQVEEAAQQAYRLAMERVVVADDGTRVSVDFETLCVHGDMEDSVARLRAIRARLDAAGCLRRS